MSRAKLNKGEKSFVKFLEVPIKFLVDSRSILEGFLDVMPRYRQRIQPSRRSAVGHIRINPDRSTTLRVLNPPSS